jgi:hypothetical protein
MSANMTSVEAKRGALERKRPGFWRKAALTMAAIGFGVVVTITLDLRLQ